jgi:hypothetical protein
VIPQNPEGWLRYKRWRFAITHSEYCRKTPPWAYPSYLYTITARPIHVGAQDKRTDRQIQVRICDPQLQAGAREHQALSNAYLIALKNHDFMCCIKHALLGIFDGTECITSEESARRTEEAV